MGETADLIDMVAHCANGDSGGARAIGSALLETPGITAGQAARVTSILALAEYLDADYSGAVIEAERGLALARASGDPDSLLIALSIRLLTTAGTPWAAADPVDEILAEVWASRSRLDELEPELRMLAGHLLVEATLSIGRMSEALEVLDSLVPVRGTRTAEAEARHPYPPFMQLQWARVAFFQGRLDDALPIATAVREDAIRLGNRLWDVLAQGYLAVICAYRGDEAATREHVGVMIEHYPQPVGYLGAAVYAIAGYSLFAIGDIERAGELGLLGGGDDDLSNLQVGDRALTFEMLVSGALLRDDLAEAERWGARSLALAAHPAAAPIVQGIAARIDLARGEKESSAELAAVSAARARLTGRYLDAARADLIRAQALAAGDQRPPSAQRVGWAGLTERERQVAVLAAEGFSNHVIGATLFLSARTVQSYMSRVLATLGITSRAALPKQVAGLRLGSPRDDLPPLTPRQREVASLVAEGFSNQELAQRLDISVKTAEKHIGEILQRWGVQSRTSIAHLVVSGSARTPV